MNISTSTLKLELKIKICFLILLFGCISISFSQGFYSYKSLQKDIGCNASNGTVVKSNMSCMFRHFVKIYMDEYKKLTPNDEFLTAAEKKDNLNKARMSLNKRWGNSELAEVPFSLPEYNADKQHFGAGYIPIPRSGWYGNVGKTIVVIDYINGRETKDFRFKYYIKLPREEAKSFKANLGTRTIWYKFDIEMNDEDIIVIRINEVILRNTSSSQAYWKFTTGINLY